MKKAFLFLFTFAIFFVFQNPTEAATEKKNGVFTNSIGVEITESEYQKLLDLGFTELAIDQMEMSVFKANKDLKILERAESAKYYEIKETPITKETEIEYIRTETELTKEEYFKKVKEAKAKENKKEGHIGIAASSDTTTTSYRRLITTISRINTTTARLHSKFIWDTMPATRSYDVLATNIDSTFTPVSGSNYAQQLWTVSNPTTGGGYYGSNATYSSSNSAWSKQSAGYGVKMNLKDDASNARVFELEGYAYFNITRSSSVVPYYINAYGNYAHAKTTVSSSFSYSLDFGGPGISYSGASSSSFDKISTHAQISY